MMTTMTTAITLYIAISLLAMLIIYGACLAAARADSVERVKNCLVSPKAQPEGSVAVEELQQT